MNKLKVEIRLIPKALHVLRALNHKLRLDIIRTIHYNKQITVTDLYTVLNLEQAVASQQLRILRGEGIVETQKKGVEVYYRLNYKKIEQVNISLKGLFPTSKKIK